MFLWGIMNRIESMCFFFVLPFPSVKRNRNFFFFIWKKSTLEITRFLPWELQSSDEKSALQGHIIFCKTHSCNRHSAILSNAAHKILFISRHVVWLHTSLPITVTIYLHFSHPLSFTSSPPLFFSSSGPGGWLWLFFFFGPFPGEREALECRPSHSFP